MRTLIAFVLLSGLAFGQPATWTPLTGTPTTLVPAPAFSAVQVHSSVFKIKGSSSGLTSLGSANASANNYTATLQAASGTVAYTTDLGTVTVADEAADTTSFPLFATQATGSLLSIKSNAGLTFNASTATLGATGLTVTNDATINGLTVGRGSGNVALNTVAGKNALVSNISGNRLTAFGESALYHSTGDYSAAFGQSALDQTTDGYALVGIGFAAGSYLTDHVTPNTSSHHSIYIGHSSTSGAANETNAIVIGALAEGMGSNSTVIGINETATFRAWGTPTFGGTNSLTFSLASLTAARTATMPDASGTMTLLGNTSTGSGSVVLATSPTLVTPTLGVATATSLACPTFTTASGAMGFTPASGSNFNITLATTGDFVVNTSQVYVDTSAARVGFGTNAPGYPVDVRASGGSTIAAVNTAASGASAGAGILLYHDDGAAIGSGDRLGQFLFGGTVDTSHAFTNTASVSAFATQNWSPTQAGTDLRFFSTPNGTITRAEGARLDNAGNWQIGHTGTALGKFEVRTTSGVTAAFSNTANEWLGITVGATGTCTYDITTAGTSRHVFADRINIPTSTPASASATGTTGDIAWDASYIYVCTATNTWKRVAIATW